jgi:hypothetical protein
LGKSHFNSQIVPVDATEQVGRVWLPWQMCIGGQITGAAETLDTHGAGDAVTVASINSSGFTGMAVAADNDAFPFMWVFPNDIQLDGTLDWNIYVWCHLAAAAETGDAAAWTVQYKAFNGTTDTLAAFTTTLGVTAGTLTWVADHGITRSTAIACDVSAMTTLASTDNGVLLNVVCTDIDNAGAGFATNEQNFLGVEIEYGRRFV